MTTLNIFAHTQFLKRLKRRITSPCHVMSMSHTRQTQSQYDDDDDDDDDINRYLFISLPSATSSIPFHFAVIQFPSRLLFNSFNMYARFETSGYLYKVLSV